MIKTLKCILLIFSTLFMTFPSFGADLSSYSLLNEKGTLGKAMGSEYVSGARPGSVLMRVNIWGGVGKPGIHHVPAKTNLINLLSYAGGPQKDAILDEVLIKRDTGKVRQRIRVDVDELINGNGISGIPLEPNDIIVVPVQKPYITQNTVILLSVISTAVTIIATGLIISDRK